mmetsp:Transcript_31263/g.57208  ORF Transcript_31263/g.57208 Transcript_31263/m.57208 type:complete len:635 (-) Transcript_31263:86-1990(-)
MAASSALGGGLPPWFPAKYSGIDTRPPSRYENRARDREMDQPLGGGGIADLGVGGHEDRWFGHRKRSVSPPRSGPILAPQDAGLTLEAWADRTDSAIISRGRVRRSLSPAATVGEILKDEQGTCPQRSPEEFLGSRKQRVGPHCTESPRVSEILGSEEAPSIGCVAVHNNTQRRHVSPGPTERQRKMPTGGVWPDPELRFGKARVPSPWANRSRDSSPSLKPSEPNKVDPRECGGLMWMEGVKTTSMGSRRTWGGSSTPPPPFACVWQLPHAVGSVAPKPASPQMDGLVSRQMSPGRSPSISPRRARSAMPNGRSPQAPASPASNWEDWLSPRAGAISPARSRRGAGRSPRVEMEDAFVYLPKGEAEFRSSTSVPRKKRVPVPGDPTVPTEKKTRGERCKHERAADLKSDDLKKILQADDVRNMPAAGLRSPRYDRSEFTAVPRSVEDVDFRHQSNQGTRRHFTDGTNQNQHDPKKLIEKGLSKDPTQVSLEAFLGDRRRKRGGPCPSKSPSAKSTPSLQDAAQTSPAGLPAGGASTAKGRRRSPSPSAQEPAVQSSGLSWEAVGADFSEPSKANPSAAQPKTDARQAAVTVHRSPSPGRALPKGKAVERFSDMRRRELNNQRNERTEKSRWRF